MPQFAQSSPRVFDAVIVGSGATGGWAAKELTEAGLDVALLEAGPPVTPDQFGEHVPSYELKYRDRRRNGVASPEIARLRPMHALQGACSEVNYKWFANDIENPFTTPEDKPFVWVRVRALGGRSLTWGRQSYRLSDLDFKAAGRDGVGIDWPFSYKDLAPYAEDFLPGGAADGSQKWGRVLKAALVGKESDGLNRRLGSGVWRLLERRLWPEASDRRRRTARGRWRCRQDRGRSVSAPVLRASSVVRQRERAGGRPGGRSGPATAAEAPRRPSGWCREPTSHEVSSRGGGSLPGATIPTVPIVPRPQAGQTRSERPVRASKRSR